MSEFLKPQSPLQHKDGAFLYPLTTADQVILEDNNRLNFALEHLVYVDEEHQESAVASSDADTLGGHPVEDFVQVETFENYAASIDENIKENTKPKAGFIYPLAGSVVPDGFLLCDGAEYSRVQYEELFVAIGTIYGAGDGSTTFNVPNLQTRVPVGAGEGYGLGAVGGEATHTLTVDEMPSHRHSYNVNIQHVDGEQVSGESLTSGLQAGGRRRYSDNTGYKGGSQPHNNMQPYTVVNYIIATGKDTGVSVSDIVFGAQAIPLGVEYGGTGATNAADALKNLGGLSMELLWENASPTSWFAEQTISVNLSQFSMCCIEYNGNVGDTNMHVCFAPIGYITWLHSEWNFRTVREANIKTNSIVFGKGMHSQFNEALADYNGVCVPIKIYGIKGVSA